ncbi:MAG: hypothetical protein FWH18_10905 [Marinilabiliaceae bacterium]|nr:hypothetical protein [Marinilabiliaceae bacterium]
MLKNKRWDFIEGWTICVVIFLLGTILQLLTGNISSKLFEFPYNLIFTVLFLGCLIFFHFLSNKIIFLRWFSGGVATITVLLSLLFMLILMGFTRQLPSSVDISNANLLIRIGLMQMTVSWQFFLISLYFLWVLGLVILKKLCCFRIRDLGFIFTHGGLFVAYFSLLLGNSDFIEKSCYPIVYLGIGMLLIGSGFLIFSSHKKNV